MTLALSSRNDRRMSVPAAFRTTSSSSSYCSCPWGSRIQQMRTLGFPRAYPDPQADKQRKRLTKTFLARDNSLMPSQVQGKAYSLPHHFRQLPQHLPASSNRYLSFCRSCRISVRPSPDLAPNQDRALLIRLVGYHHCSAANPRLLHGLCCKVLSASLMCTDQGIKGHRMVLPT